MLTMMIMTLDEDKNEERQSNIITNRNRNSNDNSDIINNNDYLYSAKTLRVNKTGLWRRCCGRARELKRSAV